MYDTIDVKHDGLYSASFTLKIGSYWNRTVKAWQLVSVASFFDQIKHDALTVDLLLIGNDYYLVPQRWENGAGTKGRVVDGAKPFKFGVDNQIDIDVKPNGNVFVYQNGEPVSWGTPGAGGLSPEFVNQEFAHLGLYADDTATQMVLENADIAFWVG